MKHFYGLFPVLWHLKLGAPVAPFPFMLWHKCVSRVGPICKDSSILLQLAISPQKYGEYHAIIMYIHQRTTSETLDQWRPNLLSKYATNTLPSPKCYSDRLLLLPYLSHCFLLPALLLCSLLPALSAAVFLTLSPICRMAQTLPLPLLVSMMDWPPLFST